MTTAPQKNDGFDKFDKFDKFDDADDSDYLDGFDNFKNASKSAPSDSDNPNGEKHAGTPEDWRKLVGFVRFSAGLGTTVVVIVLLFATGGYFANRYFGTGTLGMAAAIVVGGFVGLYWSYLRVAKMLTVFFPPATKPASEPDSAKRADDDLRT